MKRELVAVVLAGGIGKRFWPMTFDKSFFPFLGRPFVDYSVINALPKEVNRVVFVANKQSYKFFQDLKLPIPSMVVTQTEPNGMADALMSAHSAVDNVSVLVMIADHLVEPGLLAKVVRRAHAKKAFGVIPGWKTAHHFPGGYLKLNGERVSDIVEKPQPGEEPSDYVAVSGHYIEDFNLLIDQIRKTDTRNDDVYEQAISVLAKHTQFMMEPYEGISSTLKYPWSVLDVSFDLLKTRMRTHRGRNIQIGKNVILEGKIYIGNNVRIFENTKIVGPVYIGDDTIIGNNNIIRDSHIGSGCVTGFNTDITRSYIGNGNWFHSNYVGDSVIEENVSMGSGTVCANLRLDEGEIFSNMGDTRVGTGKNKLGAMVGKNVRIGVNVSLMPGVKVGMGSYIGAGTLLDRDVPDGSFVYNKTDLVIKTNKNTAAPASREQFKAKL